MYRKNTSGQFVCFQGVDATSGGIKSGVTWTMRRCIDGTFAAGGGTVTEDSTNGWYKCALTQADTNGNDISFNFTGTGAVPQTINIITTACDPTTATNFGITALPATAVTTNASLLTSGTGTDQLSVASGVAKANLAQILGTALTETAGQIAAAFKQFFNIASPTSTMNAITAVTTVTNLTNAPTAGDLTATMKTSVTTAATAATPTAAAVTGAVGSVTGNVGGNVTGSVGSVVGAVGSVTGLTASNLDTTVSSRLATSGYTAPPTAAQNATAVLTTQMTESYSADGVAPTLTQSVMLTQQMLTESSVASTTLTVKKLDGSTTAATLTLNDATAPTSITRTT